MEFVIRKCGTLCDVSPDGRSPLQQDIVNLLTPFMTYQYKQQLRGAAAYDAHGTYHNMRVEPRKLYRIEQGRLTTGAGYIQRIARVLQQHGHVCRLLDVYNEADHQRPQRYVPDWDNVRRHVEFRARQEECLQAIANNYGGVIRGVTGFGKTHMVAAMTQLYPRAKFHIVIKSVSIAQRALRDLVKFVPNVGQVGGGQKRLGDRVTVFTAGSIEHSDGDADFLVADEVHELMADSYADPMSQIYRETRNFGFSATPYDRQDGASARLECLFGPKIFNLDYREGVELGLVVPVRVRWVPVRLANNPAYNRKDVARKRWGIWRNRPRNELIATVARSYTQDQQVLILVETLDHALHLWQMLPEFSLCYGSMAPERRDWYVEHRMLPRGYIPLTAKRREVMQQQFERGELRKVIATDVWSTGVDFRELAVLIRGDERESVIRSQQGPGRVSRIHHGKEYGEVVDFYDAFDDGLRRKSEQRRRVYASLGWSQETIEV